MALGPDDLVLCSGTLAPCAFTERLAAARHAGFAAISLTPDDYRGALEGDGLAPAELRQMVADAGLAVAELDPYLVWEHELDGVAAGVGGLATARDDFLTMAETVGARSVNVAMPSAGPVPLERAAGALDEVAGRAGERGLLVHLEPLPWSHVSDVDAAADVVAAVDRPNLGIMLDAWHHTRAGSSTAALRAHASWVTGIQLSDAPAAPDGEPVDETLNRRRLPGDGDADLAGIVTTLRSGGCDAPVGVEVFSRELRALPVREAARRAGDAARAVLGRA